MSSDFQIDEPKQDDQNKDLADSILPEPSEIAKPSRSKVIWTSLRLGLSLGLFFALVVCLVAPHMRELGLRILLLGSHEKQLLNMDVTTLAKQQTDLQKEIIQLRRKSDRLIPSTTFLIISPSDNKFTLMRGKKPIHQGVCSTGSNVLLKTSDDRQWMFRTPTGVFRVQDKIESPIWRKPDWAFIEEGRPVPHPYADERFDFGALGEYGLNLGDGYLIHGTLYQRMLGMPVTHGCIRLGDEDLRLVYHKLGIGSKVFIY